MSLIKAYRAYDPATNSSLEILFLYPGVKAILLHRLAHALSKIGIPFLPRMIAETSRFLTGIEIHPGAQIGKNLIIDHGMGVVIGQTAIIGDNCLIYHGVTLGGVSNQRVKRHPTVGNNVIIGSGAKILGNIRLGDHSRVGANAVVVKSVPNHFTATGAPAKLLPPGKFLSDDDSWDSAGL